MAFAIAKLRDLFTAAMLTGIFSLICAGLFVVMDAVDVAFTEAAVGAGISTVLFLGALSLTTSREKAPKKLKPLPLLIVLITGAALVYGTQDMPKYGDPNAAIHHHVANRYLSESYEKTHIPNVVTSVLASYRGYDTMGEVTVIFTAGIGVLLLLSGVRRRSPEEEAELAQREPPVESPVKEDKDPEPESATQENQDIEEAPKEEKVKAKKKKDKTKTKDKEEKSPKKEAAKKKRRKRRSTRRKAVKKRGK